MKKILPEMIQALEKGEAVILCCILEAIGSSPRKAGTKMAVFQNGRSVGTVGGGAVELLCKQKALEMLPDAKSNYQNFDSNLKIEGNEGICGDQLTVAFRIFSPLDLPLLLEFSKLSEENHDVWIRLVPGKEREKDFCLMTEAQVAAENKHLLLSRNTWKNGSYTEHVVPTERAFVFGGGHVGKALVSLLSTLDFAVTVLDEREALAKPENYPAAEHVIPADFSNIGRDVMLSENDYAVVMTPEHGSDFKVLGQVLPLHPAYIGCLGSRHKVAAMRKTLLEDGFSEEEINRIHSPIGLPILAETPEEIAVSIAAEMIAERAKKRNRA